MTLSQISFQCSKKVRFYGVESDENELNSIGEVEAQKNEETNSLEARVGKAMLILLVIFGILLILYFSLLYSFLPNTYSEVSHLKKSGMLKILIDGSF